MLGPCSKKQEMILKSDADVLICGGSAGCVDGDTEFLSQYGWKKISDYVEGDLVTQFNLNKTELVIPERYIKRSSSSFYVINNLYFTYEHIIVYKDKNNILLVDALSNCLKDKRQDCYIVDDNLNIVDTYDFNNVRVENNFTFKYCFEVSSGILVLRRNNTVFLTGNSGKSFLLLLLILRYIDCPFWRGVIFRRTTTEIESGGGLFDEGIQIYSSLPLSHRPKINMQKLSFTFPSGAVLKMSHLQHHPRDTIKQHGSQFSFVAFDELTTFEEEQFIYLFSRLRSKSKYKSRMVATCNPDVSSFVLKYVEPNLDENGYPRKELDGVTRYFIRKENNVIWGKTAEELIEQYGPKTQPLSFEFISANIYDNPVLMENRPEYVSFLESLRNVEKARLLYGCWYAKEQGDNYFKREWLKKADHPPYKGVCCRAWDKAASEPSEVNRQPDYTACIKMYKSDDGTYCIVGDYHPDVIDEPSGVSGKFRLKPGQRDQLILKQAQYDGDSCVVVMPQDPGSSGVVEYLQAARLLTNEGFIVKKDPMPPVTSKLNRYVPFASAAENGLVYIVESSFDKKTLEAFYLEHETFDGKRSSRISKDD